MSGASNWTGLPGKWKYAGGSAPATVTVPNGATVVQIIAHATSGATFTIFGGPAITLPANDLWRSQIFHGDLVATQGANQIVFGTGTTSYFVEYISAN